MLLYLTVASVELPCATARAISCYQWRRWLDVPGTEAARRGLTTDDMLALRKRAL